jgi:hypothetical protein
MLDKPSPRERRMIDHSSSEKSGFGANACTSAGSLTSWVSVGSMRARYAILVFPLFFGRTPPIAGSRCSRHQFGRRFNPFGEAMCFVVSRHRFL